MVEGFFFFFWLRFLKSPDGAQFIKFVDYIENYYFNNVIQDWKTSSFIQNIFYVLLIEFWTFLNGEFVFSLLSYFLGASYVSLLMGTVFYF